MRRIALVSLLMAAFSLVITPSVFTPSAQAAKKVAKKGKVKVSEAQRQKKLLGWTSDFPTAYTYTTPDFFIRGAVVDFKQVPHESEWEILVLPIEVINNPMHHVKMENFKNGLPIRLELSAAERKGLKKGGLIEFNQYSRELPSDDKGHAKLIKSEIHTEFKTYDTPPVAYLAKPGLEPEQIVNAIRGIIIYRGDIEKTEEIKTALASLSKNSNPAISKEAKECSNKLFGK